MTKMVRQLNGFLKEGVQTFCQDILGLEEKGRHLVSALLFTGEETGFSGGPPLFPWEC